MSLTQQLNDLLYKAFTVDWNGNIALRMTLQTGTVQSWKDPVDSLANLPPSGNTSGDVRMAMDTGILYRWNGTAWVQANAYTSGQGISISGQTVAIDLDANSGLQFISGKLALKADWTTTEVSSGTLRVKPGVFASLVHTHISSDITDWTTALNTWLATKTTANLTENTNLYFTQARVLATPLTGLSLATGTAIVATDTELVAFGKLQKQISDEVTARSNADATKEGTITAGTTSQYWRGDKSWQTLNTTAVAEGTNLYYNNSRGIGSVLTGLSLATSTDIVATDSILTAMGKLQAQNTSQGTAIGLRALDSAVVHIAGSELVTGYKGFSNHIWLQNDGDAVIFFNKTSGTNRWALLKNSSQDFVLNRYNDSGTWQNNPIYVLWTNGNIGINKSNPTEQLDVEWMIKWTSIWATQSNNEWLINFGSGSAVSGWRRGYIWHNTTDFVIANQENGGIGFDVNNTRKVTIQSNGTLVLESDMILNSKVIQTKISDGTGIIFVKNLIGNPNNHWHFLPDVPKNSSTDNSVFWGYASAIYQYQWLSNWGGWNTQLMQLLNDGNLSVLWWVKVWNSSSAVAGNIRWNGTKFQGYTGSAWVDFH